MKWQSIVVGVDGSPESASAASVAWMLARAADVPCRLVHAANDVSASLAMAGTGVVTEALQLAALGGARGELRASLQDCVPSAVVDAMVVSTGATADVLEAVVDETDAAMLVLGGKHHSRLGRWLGGSTVQEMVRRLPVPLLVTAGELSIHPRVMVAVDASYAALPTIHQAVSFARLLGSPLHALHVIDPPPAIAELPGDWSREIVERDLWPTIPLVERGKIIREGVPFNTIVDEAAAWRADVIVVGSHGKGWVDRWLIGSVTEDLLNNLPCAVLVVPVPKPERQKPLHITQPPLWAEISEKPFGTRDEPMTHILIVYGTTDGHTAKITQVLAEDLRALRCSVDIVDAAGAIHRLSPEGYDGVIVAASVHIGDYQRSVARWVRTYAAMLNGMPTAFLSVCLAVLEQNAKTRLEVANILERFFARTGWRPPIAKPIAGAVRYTRYGWLKRLMMKRIVGRAGGGTDTTRDYEYTDWNDLRAFAGEFARQVTTTEAIAGGVR